MKAVVLIAILIGLSAGFVLARSEPKPATVDVKCAAEVYFLPFDRDTLYPVDAKAIKRDYNISSCLKSEAVTRIVELLDRAEPSRKFSDGAVRFSLTLPDGRLYLVDQAGNVKKGTQTATLSERQFRSLRSLLWAYLPMFPLDTRE